MANQENKNPEEFLDGELAKEAEGQLTVDVYQNNDELVVQSTVAGVVADDLDINITSESVTIRGKRTKEEKVEEKDYFYQECFWGNFSRSIILPCDIRGGEVEAKMKNGILTVKLPKIEKSSSTKIQVSEE